MIGKIIERVIQSQMVEHLKLFNLMSSEQHGFRKNHSTVTCLLEMTEDIRENIDKGKISGVVAIDLSKAFDTIQHKILIEKLKTLNLSENSIAWFKSYLSGRRQKVRINETLSESGIVKYGVPQGSILGPLLFSLYINDLTKYAGKCKVKIYADDTTIYTGSDSENTLKQDLEQALKGILNYFSKIGLKCNAEKCQFMVIGNKKRLEEVTLNVNGHILNQAENIKILGVTFDRGLKWDSHIQNITKKCRSLLGILFKGRHLVDQNTKKLLYNAMVQSRLNYADVIWDSCSEGLAQQVQKIQNSGIRYIFGLKKYDHVSEYRTSLKWVTVKEKRKQHILQLFHKIRLKESPINLFNKIRRSEINHGHSTRNAIRGNLTINYARTNTGKNSFINKAIKQWNEMPNKLRQSVSVPAFRIKTPQSHI